MGIRQVLTTTSRLLVHLAVDSSAAVEDRDRTMTYFTKRLEQVDYAAFQAAGYPIGSGSTESANKIVVEARLKGSGMHWARAHVDPLVALRTVACTNRWSEAWPRISARLRAALTSDVARAGAPAISRPLPRQPKPLNPPSSRPCNRAQLPLRPPRAGNQS